MRRALAPLIAVALIAPPLPAAAQGPAPGAFTTEEAAWCGVVFARMAEAMRAIEGIPAPLRDQAEVGLAIWEYEMIASAPGRDEYVEREALAAIDRLADALPAGGGETDANARGEFLMTRAQGCMERIDAVYTDGPHPIVAQIAAARGIEVPGQSAPVQAEAAASAQGGEAPKRVLRGLR